MGRPPLGPAPYDRIVVGAIVSGERVRGHIHSADAWESVRRLAGLGFSDGQIAMRVDRTRRQVERIRRGLGIPAPAAGCNQNTLPIPNAPSRNT